MTHLRTMLGLVFHRETAADKARLAAAQITAARAASFRELNRAEAAEAANAIVVELHAVAANAFRLAERADVAEAVAAWKAIGDAVDEAARFARLYAPDGEADPEPDPSNGDAS